LTRDKQPKQSRCESGRWAGQKFGTDRRVPDRRCGCRGEWPELALTGAPAPDQPRPRTGSRSGTQPWAGGDRRPNCPPGKTSPPAEILTQQRLERGRTVGCAGRSG
jgi:hypothetical protein